MATAALALASCTSTSSGSAEPAPRQAQPAPPVVQATCPAEQPEPSPLRPTVEAFEPVTATWCGSASEPAGPRQPRAVFISLTAALNANDDPGGCALGGASDVSVLALRYADGSQRYVLVDSCGAILQSDDLLTNDAMKKDLALLAPLG